MNKREQASRDTSLVKTITWRVVATFTTLGIAYLFTGNFAGSLAFTLTTAIISMIAYYVHERVWSHIHLHLKHKR